MEQVTLQSRSTASEARSAPVEVAQQARRPVTLPRRGGSRQAPTDSRGGAPALDDLYGVAHPLKPSSCALGARLPRPNLGPADPSPASRSKRTP